MTKESKKLSPRRLLAWALTVCMLCALLPVSALAEENGPAVHTHCVCGGTSATLLGDHTEHTGLISYQVLDAGFQGGALASGSYYLTDDVTVTQSITIAAGAEVNLCLNGHKLIAGGNQNFSLLVNQSGAMLNLCDCKGSGQLTQVNSENAGCVDNSGTFHLYSGSITGNQTSGSGGGVCNAGAFTMYNGKIEKNVAQSSGAGVCNAGTFTMYGGSIENNKVYNDTRYVFGGGVYNAGSLIMYDGSLTGNTSSYAGGGIYSTSGDATLYRVSFTDNAAHHGGGIYNEARFTMNGGDFTSNGAEYGGGGIYNGAGGDIDLDSVVFSGNASANGGAVYNEDCRITLRQCRFSGNSATLGGTVYNDSGAFECHDGLFSSNIASYGGVAFNRGTCSFYGKSIMEENIATADGGAVYNMATCNFDGGSVTGNTAEGDGGGIYNDCATEEGLIVSRGIVNLQGDVCISGNRASNKLENNICLFYDVFSIALTGKLGDNAQIGVTSEKLYADTVIATGSGGYVPTRDDAARFFSDDPAYRVTLKEGSIMLSDFPEARYRDSVSEAWIESSLSDALSTVADGGEIQLLKSMTEYFITTDKTLTLDLNGKQCSAPTGSFALSVFGPAQVTLTDSAGGGKLVGGDGAQPGNPGQPAVLLEGGTLALAGDKAFTLQGGEGADGQTTGGVGVAAETGKLIVTNPSVICQGGAGGGRGGDGCIAADGASCAITGGVFQGGSGGDGGNGLTLSGTVNGELTVTEARGGSPGTGGGISGTGLLSTSPLTIAGGRYRGDTAARVSASGQTLIKGGSFTGTRFGLALGADSGQHTATIENAIAAGDTDAGLILESGDAVVDCTVKSGSFTGGLSGIVNTHFSNRVALCGGAYTAMNETGFAVQTPQAAVSGLLGAGFTYYDKDGIVPEAALNAERLGSQSTITVAKANETYYAVSGKVTDSNGSPVAGVAVTIKQGKTSFGRSTTDAEGKYAFSTVKPGVYNVVAEQGDVIKTIMVIVTDGDRAEQNITMPHENKSSVVEVVGDTPPVVVGGLDEVAEVQDDNTTVKLTVEQMDAPADKEEIEQVATGQALLFLDLSLFKIVNNGAPETIAEPNAVLEIVVPYAMAGKDNVTVYRKHGSGAAVSLAKLSAAPGEPPEGSYWLDAANDLIHIYTGKFSTYAIGYTVGGGTSGGGGGNAGYTITATAGAGGSITPSGKVSVTRNSDKTFAIAAKDGYEIADVLVDGKSVGAVGSYTFKKVDKTHTIEARFQQTDGAADGNPFRDVSTSDWFYDSVQYVYEQGLMNGTGETMFSPQVSTSRGMIVTILWRMEGQPESGAAMPFADVKAGSYCHEAVAWAAANGIVKGYDADAFGPDDGITREQLAAILYRYAQHKGYDVSVGEDTNMLSYTDFDQISSYAIPALQWACGAGILNGKDGGRLDPTGSATRAETAAVLERFIRAAR